MHCMPSCITRTCTVAGVGLGRLLACSGEHALEQVLAAGRLCASLVTCPVECAASRCRRQAPTGCSRRAGKELSSRRSPKAAELAPPPAAAAGGGGGGGGGGSRGKKGEKFRALKAKEAAKKAARQAAPAAGPGPAQAQAQAQPRASEVAVAEKLKARARPQLPASALQTKPACVALPRLLFCMLRELARLGLPIRCSCPQGDWRGICGALGGASAGSPCLRATAVRREAVHAEARPWAVLMVLARS